MTILHTSRVSLRRRPGKSWESSWPSDRQRLLRSGLCTITLARSALADVTSCLQRAGRLWHRVAELAVPAVQDRRTRRLVGVVVVRTVVSAGSLQDRWQEAADLPWRYGQGSIWPSRSAAAVSGAPIRQVLFQCDRLPTFPSLELRAPPSAHYVTGLSGSN
jgi:hypothetical protein